MKVVQNYAQSNTGKTAKIAVSSRQTLEEHSTRLDQLANYRNEYWQNLSSQGINNLNSVRLQDYRLFISRLDQAIDQQKDLVVQAEAECVSCTENWNKARVREKSIDTVVDKLQKKESQNKEKTEQKQMDEMGQKIRIRLYEK